MYIKAVLYIKRITPKMAGEERSDVPSRTRKEGMQSSYDPDAFDSMFTINSETWNEGNADEAGEGVEWNEDVLKAKDITVSGPMFLTLAQAGNLTLVKRMHESLGEDVIRYKDEDGYSALHRACYNGHLGVAEYLIAAGADVNNTSEDGWQPLHSACKWNKVAVASLLLQNGAHINATTKGGQTALHLTASNNRAAQTLELLLTHPSIDPDVVNGAGETPHQIAARSGPHSHLFDLVDPALHVT